MTVLKRVSAKQMKQRTGFGKALGYAFPEKDEILVRKDLPKEVEKEVLAHEEDHIEKGEEGPFLGGLIAGIGSFLGSKAGGAIIGAGASLLGAKKSSDAAKDATRAQVDAANKEIAYARETRDLLRKDQEPYRKAGYTALDALMSLTGLGASAGGSGDVASRQQSRGLYGLPADLPAYKENQILRNYRRSSYGRATGGNIVDGEYYNINELGPESVYSGGKVTRTPNPQTITDKEGYVQPNIKGRAIGGYIGGDYRPAGMDSRIGGYGPPNRPPPEPVSAPPAQTSSIANTTAVNPDTGYPNENPGGVEGGYNFMTEPGYQFRFSEGMRALDRGAAARGGLLSGGYARKAIRYGQGFASNEFANVYNRIANIAGLGQTANQANMYGALNTSQQIGNALSNQGAARASGYVARGNAWSNAINDVANLPWGGIFNQQQGVSYTPSGVPGLDYINVNYPRK